MTHEEHVDPIFTILCFICLVEVILGSTFKVALLNETRLMYQAVPGWASLIIFLVVLFLLGVMEGIQVGSWHWLQSRKLPRSPW